MTEPSTDTEPEKLRITDGDGTILLAGEVDANTCHLLESVLDDRAGTEHVVCDLSDVTFIDSSGLRVLIATHGRLTEQGGSFELRRPSEAVVRLFELTGVDEHLTIT